MALLPDPTSGQPRLASGRLNRCAVGMTLDQLLDDVCSPTPARVATGLQAAGSQHRELAVPLRARLEHAATQPEAWIGEGKPSPVFLCFLAAAWRETTAHVPIVRLFRLPPKQSDALLGDLVTEDGPTILADTFGGDFGPLRELVADAAADPFARGAGLHALARLVARGRHDRLALIETLRQLADPLDPAREDDSTVANGIVDVALELRAWELRDLALGLYDRGLADPMCIGPEKVEAELVPGVLFDPAAGKLQATITDAWTSVARWYFFDPLRPARKPQSMLPPPPAPRQSEFSDAPDGFPKPYIAPPKPGRNDPCSCGSGKKYKKCCGQ